MISLLIAGEFASKHACTAGDTAAAVKACTTALDDVGLLQLGWMHFLHTGLVGSYLVLLGIPAAAGVAAKGITQSKITSGAVPKIDATPDERTIGPRLAQLFSADDGSTDVGDFQYVIFNLITAVYFVSRFVKPNGNGLPAIPDTLLGLTSVSAALYVGKKAVARSEPTVTGVFPSILRPEAPFTVTGTGLWDPLEPGPNAPEMTVNGKPAIAVVPDPTVADRLTAVAPPEMNPPGTPPGTERAGTLQVMNGDGATTKGFTVSCL
ncbi:MAG TPA: hypothetical protein VNZ01_14305 [Solirubrobacteraceae bacterium]|nr:hypothetical protein [Solirubrobacteraceae bacterium]